jgi:hypothetical protein
MLSADWYQPVDEVLPVNLGLEKELGRGIGPSFVFATQLPFSTPAISPLIAFRSRMSGPFLVRMTQSICPFATRTR